MILEHLIDPMGGSNQGKKMDSGSALVMGFGADLMGKYMLRPAALLDARDLRKQYRSATDAVRTVRDRRLSLIRPLEERVSVLGARRSAARSEHMRFLHGAGTGNIDLAARRSDSVSRRLAPLEARLARMQRAHGLQSQHLQKLRAQKSSRFHALRSTRDRQMGFYKGVGWTLLLGFLFDAGAQAFTPGITQATARDMSKMQEQMFQDSSQAYTMRQRAIQAIHDSQLSPRSIIGQEAAYLHM